MHNLNNYSSGSHYANIRYNVVETRIGFGLGKKAKLIVADNLDSNGHAEFTLKMKSNYNYSLAFARPDDICYNNVPFEHFLNQNETNNLDFEYAACGYVSVPTNNVNCEGDDDKMQYKYYYSDDSEVYLNRGFSNSSSWSENTFVNGCISYSGGFESVPSGNYTFEWRVIRPSGTTTGTDTFYVGENDTTTYILEY